MKTLKNSLVSQKYTEITHEEEIKFNAPHHFLIRDADTHAVIVEINMQEGPIKEHGVNGCANEDLIAIVLTRLEYFQNSPYRSRENAVAITKLEEALMWLRKRTTDRELRDVEGTSNI